MIILPDNEEAIAAAIVILRDGGVVAHATETCYGFACDMTNETAVRKLFAIKERSEDHPVSALFPSVEEAKHYVLWNEEAEKLAADSLPGPLTLILPLLSSAPQKLFPIPSIQSLCLAREKKNWRMHLGCTSTHSN